MDEKAILEQVAETGRLLLEKKLVARTWGNFSARLDKDHFAITPSGLGYETMSADDIVRFCFTDDTYEGPRKPSSEKGIHAEAYRLFPHVGFVIHTHQPYATALGLSSKEQLQLTPEENDALGSVAFANYGLPGTKKLKKEVSEALNTGAAIVLMKHHGALICGVDRDDAIQKAMLLEDVCCRSLCCDEPVPDKQDSAFLLARVKKEYPFAMLEEGDASRTWGALKIPLPAQLDDMAQMIGPYIPVAKDEHTLLKLLKKSSSVFMPAVGAVVCGKDEADTKALQVLTEKAAIAALHTRALYIQAKLNFFDCLLMRTVYLLKYSKKKEG